MFPEAIRAIREARPKAFVFENVKGLTRTAFRNYFEYVRLQLEHPNVATRGDEDWIDHLARLERHHTSGIRAAPKGNRNALKHGEFTAEATALRREVLALAWMARETLGAIE
jgi:hypothetical protein